MTIRRFWLPHALKMRLRLWMPDILGITWVAVAAVAVLLPALIHGASLGPFNLLGVSGLSKTPGTSVHNGQMLDQIQAFIPWTTLAWQQVHAGHVPLWNPYSLLGLPLAFNWQSAPFSVPALFGYMVPLRFAYTAQLIVTMLIAGLGVYVLSRLLRLSVLGCVMAATTFELSGSFFGWLGWSVAGVMSWAGWLFAAALLIARGKRRARAITFLSVVVACAIYAGQPETLVLLLLALIVWTGALLCRRIDRLGGESGPILRPILDTTLGTIAGALLGAPLILPGYELLSTSTRRGLSGGPALPLHNLAHFVLQGFDGLPIAGSTPVEGKNWYSETAAFVCVIAIVLAIVAVAFRWRRPEVFAFGVLVAVMGALVFVNPLVLFLNKLPVVRGLEWHRALVPLSFALAVLAGIGADALIRSDREHSVWSWTGIGFVAAALVLAVVWMFGRGDLLPAQSATRARSFLWPVIETAVGLAVVAAFRRRHQRRPRRSGDKSIGVGRWMVASLLICQTAVLVAAGAPLWSSSPTFLAPTQAEITYARAVGSSTVGFGTHSCSVFSALGIVPDVNIVYGIREFAVYDPATPLAYPRSWVAATGHPESGHRLGFCPTVSTVAVARRFGVSYVLEPAGYPGPPRAVFDKTIGGEELFRIPGVAAATLTPRTSTGSFPGADAPGTAVRVMYPNPSTWKVVTHSKRPQVLRLRLTDVPGWHGSIDGRPIHFRPFSSVMLQAVIPPGNHTVVVTYWPTAFTIGLVLAFCSAAVLGCALFIPRIRRLSARGSRKP
jgi:hypothetical protein